MKRAKIKLVMKVIWILWFIILIIGKAFYNLEPTNYTIFTGLITYMMVFLKHEKI